MSSAKDILEKHSLNSRYVYRSPKEHLLSYQISGTESKILAKAAQKLQVHGADIIDINCGCPKSKIRKKGAGSALLEKPEQLVRIIEEVRAAIAIPLTIKIRIQGNDNDLLLAKKIEEAGADALIIHGRRWVDDYDIASDFEQIAHIKKMTSIPVIANGDIHDLASLQRAIELSGCDAFMISRAGTGKPWLYKELLEQQKQSIDFKEQAMIFRGHLQQLAKLENEMKAVLQSKSLIRYYFGKLLNASLLNQFYTFNSLDEIYRFLDAMPQYLKSS